MLNPTYRLQAPINVYTICISEVGDSIILSVKIKLGA